MTKKKILLSSIFIACTLNNGEMSAMNFFGLRHSSIKPDLSLWEGEEGVNEGEDNKSAADVIKENIDKTDKEFLALKKSLYGSAAFLHCVVNDENVNGFLYDFEKFMKFVLENVDLFNDEKIRDSVKDLCVSVIKEIEAIKKIKNVDKEEILSKVGKECTSFISNIDKINLSSKEDSIKNLKNIILSFFEKPKVVEINNVFLSAIYRNTNNRKYFNLNICRGVDVNKKDFKDFLENFCIKIQGVDGFDIPYSKYNAKGPVQIDDNSNSIINLIGKSSNSFSLAINKDVKYEKFKIVFYNKKAKQQFVLDC